MSKRSSPGMLIGLGSLVLALTGAVLTGCASGPSSGSSSAGSANMQKQFEQWRAEWVSCMASKGYEEPGAASDEKQDPGFAEASAACIQEVGDPPNDGRGGEVDVPEMRKQINAMVQCLRKNGVDIEPPAPGKEIDWIPPKDTPEEVFEQCSEKSVGR